MCSKSWTAALSKTLDGLARLGRPPRLAVVGVGHELRGDDGMGPYLARRLRSDMVADDSLLVIDAGAAPENFCGVLRRFQPDLVLLVDAAQMDAPPGTVRWLDWQAAAGFDASTHTLPLRIFAAYLNAELGCRLALLGIQPAANEFGTPLTPGAQAAAEATAHVLGEIISLSHGEPPTGG
jgi:hydrogenase 3 maturation protease